MEEIEYNVGDLLDIKGNTYRILEINNDVLVSRAVKKDLYIDKRAKIKNFSKENRPLKIRSFDIGDIVCVDKRGKIGWEFSDNTLGNEFGQRLNINNFPYVVEDMTVTNSGKYKLVYLALSLDGEHLGIYHPNHFKKI